MTRHAEQHTLTNLLQAFRRRTHRGDDLGFGYSRTDTNTEQVAVPDGVDLHFFTGRNRQEAIR